MKAKERPVHWVGSSKEDLLSFPPAVVRDFGYALGILQLGGIPADAKPWKGVGSGVFELRADGVGGTFRVVCVVRLKSAVYVLHCFQKKSTTGIRTSRRDVERVARRLQLAEEDHAKRYEEPA